MANVTYLPTALDAQINTTLHRINKERARNRWVAAIVALSGAVALLAILWAAAH